MVKRFQVLVFEPEDHIFEIMAFVLEVNFNFKVVRSDNIAKIHLALNSTERPVKALFVDFLSEKISSKELFEHIIDNGIQIPFISTGTKLPEDLLSYRGVPIDGFVLKNEISNKLVNIVENYFKKDEEFNGEKYCRVSIVPLKRVLNISNDIYIQLLSKRFVKVFNKDDSITSDDIDKYIKRGVNFLFLDRLTCRWILSEINRNIDKLVDNPTAVINMDEAESKHVREDTLTDVTLSPVEYYTEASLDGPIEIDESLVEDLKAKVDKIVEIISTNISLKDLLKNIKISREDRDFLQTRRDIVCNIACSITNDLEWGSSAVYEKIIYVAYTHDMMISNNLTLCRLNSLRELESADLTELEEKRFKEHTEEMAEIVANDFRAPKEASVMIKQHHEMPDRSGFPLGLQGSRIASFSAVMIVSIHMANAMMAEPNWNIKEYLKIHRNIFKGGIFNKIMKSLISLSGVKF